MEPRDYSTIFGMDLGDDYCYWARMARDCEDIMDEGRVRTTRIHWALPFLRFFSTG